MFPVPLQYSTQAWASSIVPEPMFTQMYGSVSRTRQYSMNSFVPKRFDSSAYHASSLRRGRSPTGPTPSVQWYPLTKLPPGQRSTGTRSGRTASSTSRRKPRASLSGDPSSKMPP